MSADDRIIVTEQARTARGSRIGLPLGAALALGVLLVLVGGFDLALLWVPPRFGVAEWEFGTVSRFFEGLPAFTVGFVLILIVGLLDDRRPLLWLVGVLGAVVWAVAVAGVVLFALTVPLALRAVPQGDAMLALKKGVAKTLFSAGVYLVAYLVFAVRALRGARAK